MLGPLEVSQDGAPLPVEAPKERAVLEVLALRVGEVVSAETLVDALWGDHPPGSALKTARTHVSRLRRALPAGAIATEASGYRLAVPADAVDAHRFLTLAEGGRQALRDGDPGWAVALLEDAVGLWQGAPLSDLADGELRQGQVARLAEVHADAEERLTEAHLVLGHHELVVANLESLVAEEPLREHRWAQLMLALYRGRRRAEALAAYQRLRRLLRDELGIEPSEELQRLEGQILRDAPDLVPPPPPRPRRLPIPLTSFVGRERAVREVRKDLEDHRLVTLVGPGGVGKSRLAVEVAHAEADDWPDGVWWLDLARVGDGEPLATHLVRALRIVVPAGTTPDDALRWSLASQTVLLVMDNAEVLVGPSGAELTALLEAGPDIAVLVTSRLPLRIPGEHEVRVPPLEVPGPDDPDLAGAEAVQLLLARLSDHDTPVPDQADMVAIAELCRLVDGLPLGIELVAGLVGRRSPADVVDELRNGAALLAEPVAGHDARRASLGTVLDSTMDMLGEVARRCLGLLGRFPADFDEQAARAVAGPDLPRALDALVAAGLVVPLEPRGAERRYRLLDTVRSYAQPLLGADESVQAERRHAQHYRELARDAGTHMESSEEARWLERLRREDANIRAALAWWTAHDAPGAVAFARALGRAWFLWGDHDGAVALLEAMVASASDEASDHVDVAWAHLRLAWPRFVTGDVDGGLAAMREAADRFAVLDDTVGRVTALCGRAHMAVLAGGDVGDVLAWYHEAIDVARRANRPIQLAWALAEVAQALALADRADDAVEDMLDEAERLFDAADDTMGLAHVYLARMLAAYARDDLDRCDAAAEVGIRYSQAVGNPEYEQILLVARAAVRVHRRAFEEAAVLLDRATHRARAANDLLSLGIGLHACSVLASATGDPVRAARLWGAASGLVPVWPLFARRYGELLAPSRNALRSAFDDEVALGRDLGVDDALALVPSVSERVT
jgi:predicted ATPase/DNA-binding SARP family transcriptional activator